MGRRGDSSGLLVLAVAAVLGVMSLASAVGGDASSALGLGLLAAAGFAADLVLRRRSGRPGSADFHLTWLVVIAFSVAFAAEHDWLLLGTTVAVTAAAEVAVASVRRGKTS